MSSNRPGHVDVSVLVPVLNEESHICDAARAMLEQRFDGEIEFIFVDGGSRDGTRAMLEELAAADRRARVLDNPRRTTPVALNIALAASRGEVIARMDAHTIYPPDYIARGLERLRRGDAVHVSGPALPYGTGKWSRRVALALSTRLGTGGADFRRLSSGEVDVDTGFAGLWWRSTLEAHGGWDDEWRNDQDYELAARLRKAGGRMVCLPEMAAHYVPRDSLEGLARQYFRYGVYRAKTSHRHPESMRRSHVLPPGLVVALALCAVPRRRVAWPARAGALAYALSLVAVALRQAREGNRGDAAALPVVLATMHLTWGLGFMTGSLRFGPPLAALGHVAGLGRRREPARPARRSRGRRLA
jgi:succinoglycan biosynthesis protein ExoA